MFIVLIWSAIVSQLVSTTLVRDNCIKKDECRIEVKKVGYEIVK